MLVGKTVACAWSSSLPKRPKKKRLTLSVSKKKRKKRRELAIYRWKKLTLVKTLTGEKDDNEKRN